MKNENKILILCKKGIYKYVKDYIFSLKSYLNMECLIFDRVTLDVLKTNINNSNIIIFIQHIKENLIELFENKKVLILNIEQMSVKKKRPLLNRNYPIIDYSLENIKLIKDIFKIDKIFYLPYGYNKNEIYDFEKIYSVCMVSKPDVKYREKIFLELSSKFNATRINGMFDRPRDNILFRHKILVNVHFDSNYNVHETMRCDRCVYNKVIVISERSIYENIYSLSKFMIFVDYHDLVSETEKVLNNYEYYFKKLFVDQDFDNFLIEHEKQQQLDYDKEIDEM